MTVIRRKLGAWSMAWLLCQAAALVALLPLDCCPAHREAVSGSKECHTAAPADACPMASAGGAMCPMHQAGATRSEKSCTMRGVCAGPVAALAALFSLPGVISETTIALVPPVASSLFFMTAGPVFVPAPHDTPPPRA